MGLSEVKGEAGWISKEQAALFNPNQTTMNKKNKLPKKI
jgi:hypothetical protein